MSRSLLCWVSAAVLAVGSLLVLLLRISSLGPQAFMPTGPNTWRITLVAHGKIVSADAQLSTAAPLELPTQHLLREDYSSDVLDCRPIDSEKPLRRRHVWSLGTGQAAGSFHLRCEFLVSLAPNRALDRALSGERLIHLHAPPAVGEYVDSELHIESTHPSIGELARLVVGQRTQPTDQAEALYRFVSTEIANEPSVGGESRSALACLRRQAGDSTAKSRLLVALLRNRGIPARLVVGLAHAGDHTHGPHVWVEAYLDQHWKPMCPFYRHFGKLPRSYIVFAQDDPRLVRGRGIRNLDYGYLIEKVSTDTDDLSQSWLARQFLATSPYMLPPAEQHLVEFLLLLPLAALIVCIFRNLVGLHTFGTFAPALVGLAFRQLHSLPGLAIFLAILLAGWLMRRLLDRLHLLQVPRTACMLSLVVMMLILFVLLAHRVGLNATHYISLFPLVILTGMIERFWTLEAEDGTSASFRTLLATLAVAGCIGAVLSLAPLTRTLLSFPELLGLVLACQLLLGRYTGYRLSELLRFRDLLTSAQPLAPSIGRPVPVSVMRLHATATAATAATVATTNARLEERR